MIIDAGGRDSKELRTGLFAADILYVPIRASQTDLETLPKVNELIGLARGMNPNLRAYALISMAPTNPMINEARDAQELIAEFAELKLAPCHDSRAQDLQGRATRRQRRRRVR